VKKTAVEISLSRLRSLCSFLLSLFLLFLFSVLVLLWIQWSCCVLLRVMFWDGFSDDGSVLGLKIVVVFGSELWWFWFLRL
jgi:hypothetical protein